MPYMNVIDRPGGIGLSRVAQKSPENQVVAFSQHLQHLVDHPWFEGIDTRPVIPRIRLNIDPHGG